MVIKQNICLLLFSILCLCNCEKQKNKSVLKKTDVKLTFNGEVDKIKHRFFNGKVAINATNFRGYTMLHIAALTGESEMVDFLLANKANTNALSAENETPLMLSSLMGHFSIVKKLGQQNKFINFKCNQGNNALAYASMPSCVGSLYYSTLIGLKLNCRSNDVNEKKAIIDFLITNHIDYSNLNLLGQSALHIAIEWNDVKIVKHLLNKGIDVNGYNSFTPLKLAAFQGKNEIVMLLIEHGADINKVSTSGYSPLSMAVRSSHYSTVKILMENGYKYKKSLLELNQLAKDTLDKLQKEQKVQTPVVQEKISNSKNIIYYIESIGH